MKRSYAAVCIVASLATLLLATPVPAQTGAPYAFNWLSTQSSPQLYAGAGGWDVQIHKRDTGDDMQPMSALHGVDCAAPPATHPITTLAQGVFICKNHLMTAINDDGYGAIYLTPDHMVDFSSGTASIKYNESTLRTSNRDWTDMWVTPFAENLADPLQSWLPDLNGPPKHAVHISMSTYNGDTTFVAEVYNNYQSSGNLDSNWWTGYDTFLKESATTRTTFELDISRTHIRFGAPAFNFWWVDTAIPDLGWSQGVVQLGDHSYNPTKSDGCGPPNGQATCQPNTWHWSDFAISNAIPFTIINGVERSIHVGGATAVHFQQAAPANAFLRFHGISAVPNGVQISVDGGATWTSAIPQAGQKSGQYDNSQSYWTPIPAGVTQVMFRGTNWFGGPWWVRDPAIWSLSGA